MNDGDGDQGIRPGPDGMSPGDTSSIGPSKFGAGPADSEAADSAMPASASVATWASVPPVVVPPPVIPRAFGHGAAPELLADPDATIERNDLVCVRCGFSLRGLRVSMVCPECGTAVQSSLRGDLLEFVGTAHLRRLRLGAVFAFIGLLGEVVASIAAYGLGFGLSFLGVRGISDASIELGAGLADLAATGVLFWGWWLLTARDPARTNAPEPHGSNRLAIRVLLVVGLVTSVAGLIGSLFYLGATATTPIVLVALSIVGYLLMVARGTLQIAFVQHLALRAPDRGLHRFAKVLVWLYPCLMIFGLAICVGPLAAWVLYAVLLGQLMVRLSRLVKILDQVGAERLTVG